MKPKGFLDLKLVTGDTETVKKYFEVAAARCAGRDRNGIDWVIKRKRAGKRAARLFKNAETTSANDNVEFELAFAA
jgi:hypothetical protein